MIGVDDHHSGGSAAVADPALTPAGASLPAPAGMSLTVLDAQRRTPVVLTDGRAGRVVYFAPRTGKAKVEIGRRKHCWITTDQITHIERPTQ